MTPDRPQPPTSVQPITSIDDPRAITLLTTEHWSLLGARSLAYNEAFVRVGIFLTFLSMSFVGLALLAQAMSFGTDFLGVAALVLTFDFIAVSRPSFASAARTSTTCERSTRWPASVTPIRKSRRS